MSVTDVQLKLRPHTTYYRSFFLLRVPVSINGQPAQVGTDERGWLTLNSRYPSVGVTFDSLIHDVQEVLREHGAGGISNFWCEEVPLFELKITSQNDLRKLLSLEKIKTKLASRIATQMMAQLQPRDQCGSPPSLHVVVQPQVYLLVPEEKGNVILINEENMAECLALCRGSGIDMEAMFRTLPTPQSKKDESLESLRQLVNELDEVVDWFHLGIQLGIPEHVLLIISQAYPRDPKRCLTEMLSLWMKMTPGHQLSVLVQALANIGSRMLSCNLAQIHDVPLPDLSQQIAMDMSPSDESSVANLKAKVHELKVNIEHKDQELVEQDNALKQADLDRKTIAQKYSTVSQKMKTALSETENLIQEKNELNKALQLKKEELRVLKSSPMKSAHLQEIIGIREGELSECKNQVESIEQQLAAERQKGISLQQELQRVREELAEKSGELRQLRESKEETSAQLRMKRERVDMLLKQITAAGISQTSHAKQREDESAYEMEKAEHSRKVARDLRKTVQQKDEEIKRLTQHISGQEATLQKLLAQTSTQSTDDLQLQKQIGSTLSDIADSHQVLAHIEDEKHVAATRARLSQEEASSHQQQGTTLTYDIEQKTLRLQWETQRDAPVGMFRGAALVHHSTVYCIPDRSDTIYQFELNQDEWQEHSQCPHCYPGLAIIKECLTAIGGKEKSQKTNKVVSWRDSGWEEVLPPMNTARWNHAVVSNDHYVIAAGGVGGETSVELFATRPSSKTWTTVTSLPQPLPAITATLSENALYAMGGDGQTYSLSMLYWTKETSGELSHLQPSWLPVQRAPVRYSTLSIVSGEVVAVGGWRDLMDTRDIYQLNNKEWVRIGSMNTGRYWPIVTVLSGDKMVVVGGRDSSLKNLTAVELAIFC